MNSEQYSLLDFVEYYDADIFKKAEVFSEYAEDYINKQHYTFFRPLLSDCDRKVLMYDRYTNQNKEMIMMASNSYLGLTKHLKVVEAGKKALEKYGSGLCGSPLLCGYSDLHQKLERKLAKFKGCEDAMLFPSGYATNLGTLNALVRKNDLLICDRLSHASILDGSISTGVHFRTFKHNNMNELQKILEGQKDNPNGKLLIVESVYSMDGDLAPLDEITALCKKYKVRLMVDEAHATGVLGKTGRGGVEFFDVEKDVDIVMGTFSKSLGAMGGFICSTKEVINYIRFYSRPYFFSASLSPVIVASVSASLDIITSEPERRINLWKNIRYIKEKLVTVGFNIGKTESAIIPIIVGDDLLLRKMSSLINKKGLFINSVFFPAVPKNSARIRLSIMATHTKEDLDQTVSILVDAAKQYSLL